MTDTTDSAELHPTPGFPGFDHFAGTEPAICLLCRPADVHEPDPHRPGRARDIALGILVGLVVGLGVAVAVVRAAPRVGLEDANGRGTVVPAASGGVRGVAGVRHDAEVVQPDASGDGRGASVDAALRDQPSGRDGDPPSSLDGAEPAATDVAVSEPPATYGGLASWYAASGMIAAVPGWHFGDRPYRVTVKYGGRSVVVTVQDCLCGRTDRVIDLSDDAFRRLAPLSVGVIRVVIEDGGRPGPGMTPPATDVGP